MNRENKTPAPAIVSRRKQNPRPGLRGPRAEARFSREPPAQFAFGVFPTDVGFLALSDALVAFAENIGVSRGRFEAVGLAGKIGPQRFHRAQLFLRGHLVERKDGVHGHHATNAAFSGKDEGRTLTISISRWPVSNVCFTARNSSA